MAENQTKARIGGNAVNMIIPQGRFWQQRVWIAARLYKLAQKFLSSCCHNDMGHSGKSDRFPVTLTIFLLFPQ